jgi:hypothetical protein
MACGLEPSQGAETETDAGQAASCLTLTVKQAADDMTRVEERLMQVHGEIEVLDVRYVSEDMMDLQIALLDIQCALHSLGILLDRHRHPGSD